MARIYKIGEPMEEREEASIACKPKLFLSMLHAIRIMFKAIGDILLEMEDDIDA